MDFHLLVVTSFFCHMNTIKSALFPSAIFATVAMTASMAHAAPKDPIVIGNARFTVVTPNCIRIEQAQSGKFIDAPSLFAVNREARFTGYKTSKNGDATTIDTGAIRLTYINDGQPLSASNLSAIIKGDATFGTKKWTPASKNGGNLGGTTRTLDGAKGPVDIGEGVLSRDGWYLLNDSGKPLMTNDWVQARPSDSGTDWYLFGYGNNYKTALKTLTTIGGSVPMPRKSVLGTWYSRFWNFTDTDYRDLVKQYKEHDFPLDIMVLDMDWHRDGWTGWSWNYKLIPDPPKLLADLHAAGLQTTLNLHPADGVGPHEDQYKAFMEKIGEPANGKTIPFDVAN
ncbi:alpha-xylosidase, partial [bacterium]